MTEGKALRPNVAKHLEYFRGKITEHGADMVRGVLKSKDNRYKGGRLHFPLSPKDKHQLLQELGLLPFPVTPKFMKKGAADGANA